MEEGIKLNCDQLIADAEVKVLDTLPRGNGKLVVRKRPNGEQSIEILDIENYLTTPTHPGDSQEFHSADAFAEYVKQIGIPRRLYGELDGELTAVFNDTESKNDYDWGNFSASLVPQFHTMAWPWINQNGRTMSQSDFSDFLNDNSAAISEPTTAQLDTIVTNLEIARSSSFAQKVDMSNGNYTFTQVENDVPKGSVQVPKMIRLCFPLYFGSNAIELVAALRYRFQDSKLTWSYQIYQLDHIKRTEIEALWKKVSDALEIPVLW